jgi:Ca2+-binding RTX toxin-like protein
VAENLVFTGGLHKLASGTVFTGFEALNFYGAGFDDLVTGGNLADVLFGGAGDDVLDGSKGNDELRGDSGDDKVSGGDGDDRQYDSGGRDTLDGGSGDDIFILDVYGPFDRDAFIGGAGLDTVEIDRDPYGASPGARLDLQAQTLNDGLFKGDVFSQIEVFKSGGADDELFGNAGRNVFYGGYGDDVLDGRGGADFLQGGRGQDMLSGGAGADTFDFSDSYYRYIVDYYYGYPTGVELVREQRGDVITDFSHAQGDKLQVSIQEFGSESEFSLALGVKATAAEASFIFDSGTGRLWFDADGSGTEEDAYLIATLQGVTTIDRSDFLFVDVPPPPPPEPFFPWPGLI